jgi:hypothetical protein
MLKYGTHGRPRPFGVGRFLLVDGISDVTWRGHDDQLFENTNSTGQQYHPLPSPIIISYRGT